MCSKVARTTLGIILCYFCPTVIHGVYCAEAADSAGLVPIKLNTLWRVKTGEAYELRASPETISASSVDTTLGYIAAASIETTGKPLADVIPLYRVTKDHSANPDFVTENSTKTGQYQSSELLGYVWTKETPYPGMIELLRTDDIRGSNVGSRMHALISGGDSLRKPEALTGYRVASAVGSAYPRLNVNEVLVAVSGGGVTIKSNANTGGAVWEWWWGGKEFINDFDYGRQLSMAVYCETGQALQEAGDKYGTSNIPLHERHPSPTIELKNLTPSQQSTRAIPLEWTPDEHGGGRNNPVIYANAKIGKNISLDWRGPDNVDRNWPVVMYESVYEGPAFTVVNVEAPTAYLVPEFSTYYKYDPKTDTLTPVAATHAKVNISGGGADGLIIASGRGPDAIAMGVYKNDPNAGIVVYDDSDQTQGHYGATFSKWGIVYRSAVSEKWSFRSWIVTDHVRNIQSDFHQLYVWGVTSRDLKPATGR